MEELRKEDAWMTNPYFEVNSVDYSDYLFKADTWRDSLTGVGYWEVLMESLGVIVPGTFTVDDPIEIRIDGATTMMGYLDDVKPYLGRTGYHKMFWRLHGRDYGMDLAQLYFTAAAGDYQGTLSGDIIIDVINSLVAAGIPCEITPPLAGIGNRINYEWAARTYLADGFTEIAELDDYDFYVEDNVARDLHYFPIGSVAEHSTTNLISLAGVDTSNILRIEVGEQLGFKLKNYIEVTSGYVDDHWTDVEGDPAAPPAPDWAPGTVSSAVTYEYPPLYLVGKGAIRCTQLDPVNEMYMTLTFPEYNHAVLDLHDEGHIRYCVWQENTNSGGVPLLVNNVSIGLRDTAGNAIVYYLVDAGGAPARNDRKYTAHLSNAEWFEIRVHIGEDTVIGGWFPDWQWWPMGAPPPPAGFDWYNVDRIFFTSFQNSPPGAYFIIDGLQIPTVEPIGLAQNVVDPPGYRMLEIPRFDIKNQFELQAAADKALEQYLDPLETLSTTTIGQTSSVYAGQTLDVVAPTFGIGGPLITDTELYRVIKLHHSVIRNSAESDIPGYTFLTDYDLIKHPQLVNPERFMFDDTPIESQSRQIRFWWHRYATVLDRHLV